MACSKYVLTNIGSSIVNFSYRRCDDSMWDYQVELEPNQTKNIWEPDSFIINNLNPVGKCETAKEFEIIPVIMKNINKIKNPA